MATDPQGIDYAAVLADLKARRAQIDAAIAGLEAANLVQGGAFTQLHAEAQVTASATANLSLQIPPDAFFNLSIPDAAKKYLAIRKRAATTAEVIEGLRSGGQASASGDTFAVTVQSSLHRTYNQGGGIVRVSRGTWGLAEWYPNKSRKPPESSNGAG
jgi:hypothetical protein